MNKPNTNSEGLTLQEWCNAAGVPLTWANNVHVKAWNRGEDPTEWKAALALTSQVNKLIQRDSRR